MRNLRLCVVLPVWILLMAALLATGCSNPREDVRVTLCKDIVRLQAGPSATLGGIDTQVKGYEYAAVRIGFSNQGRAAQAVCYYDHKAVDETADLINDPLNAFATSPYEVVIDGQKLSRPGLAEAVKQAMLKQGREFADRAKKGIENAFR